MVSDDTQLRFTTRNFRMRPSPISDLLQFEGGRQQRFIALNLSLPATQPEKFDEVFLSIVQIKCVTEVAVD